MRRLSSVFSFACLAAAAACGSSSTSTSPSTTLTIGYQLLGKVVAAVNGVGQSTTHQFTLTSSASVAVTLNSAVETMLDGTANSTVPMGVSLGKVTNGVCAPLSGASVTTAGGATAQLTFSMPAGTNCLVVADTTVQEGPVAYTITLKY